MKVRSSSRCYCAFCRTERVVFFKKHVNTVDVGLALVGSFALMMAIWQDFDPRALMFLATALVLAESFMLIRWRMSITCTKCGFDPVIYKKNPELAAQKVKAYMQEHSNDPFWVLSPPQLKPIIKKSATGGSRLNTKA